MADKIVKFTLRLPTWIDEKISEKANEEMISKNALIVRACTEQLKKWEDVHYVKSK
ncbi:toxin-antitoxin system HicB family antitoxin [Peptoniphilus indolicus]|uniref:Uncharacterized protein n=2 Tax=Peptoniphilus indolicus TaxID=33030 RepID=G4D5K8_9FIRM|nr:toxin-antitoxin system HicB family antitoxin [Peptoniphilus indolicus]EGY78674.1 hypothetical protein HMPREF9129_1688 [Peptoniphilus indolicus ATCC 29427]SUB74427.1 Uncharacterised protein [Peptoniphilus indolicus]